MKCKLHGTVNAGHPCVVQTPDSKRAIIADVELELWKNLTHYHTTIRTQNSGS